MGASRPGRIPALPADSWRYNCRRGPARGIPDACLSLLATNFPAPSPVLPSRGGQAPNPSVRGAARPLLLAGRDPGPPRLQTRDASARPLARPPLPRTPSPGSRGRPPSPAPPDSAARPQIRGGGRRVCWAPRGSPTPPSAQPGSAGGGPLVKSEPGLRMKGSRCPCVAGRPGWPAVQTAVVGALTFRGRRQSPCRWPARRPARSSARGPRQPAGRRPEGAVCVGAGGPAGAPGGRAGPAPRTKEPRRRPLGGQCSPGARGAAPRSSCLFTARPANVPT